MRKLASTQKIKFTRAIPGADAIECVGVLGWECVAKKGEFKEGDKCVYFEIDSLLPERPEFEFLRNSCYRKDLKRFRLRTVRLRGQISQGLALPENLFPELSCLEIGSDLTDILGVEKYEPPIPAQIQGETRSLRWPIEKTDEVRVQQNEEHSLIERLAGRPYYMTVKLDGTSTTFLISPEDDEYHACGRNYSYKKDAEHSFWKISEKYEIESKLRDWLAQKDQLLAIQGECVGPGIQKNLLGLSEIDFYVFNVVDVSARKRLSYDEMILTLSQMDLKMVPVMEQGQSFEYKTQEALLDRAKGKYAEHFPTAKKHQDREGIVVRSLCNKISFKAINNDFLLKE
jgi:RNA ligase (TIGR02306 family)